MITHVILGPAGHGVTRHGAALVPDGAAHVAISQERPAPLLGQLVQQADALHVHVTDHLLGDTDDAIHATLRVLEQSNARIHLTLHDIPQSAEGAQRFRRRAEVYARLAMLASSVQVCSEHERALLADFAPHASQRAHVVRLPVDARAVARPKQHPRTLGILGFIHPGKDPQQVVDLAAALEADALFLGRPAKGHESETAELVADARRRGVSLEVTGHLSEAEMDEAIARVGVPLAAYRHISASGSIGRWIAAGRRPVVLTDPWSRELAEVAPQALTLVEPAELEDECSRYLNDADRSWFDPATLTLPTTADAARTQARCLACEEKG